MGPFASLRVVYQQEDGLESDARNGSLQGQGVAQAVASEACREDEACKTERRMADRYDEFYVVEHEYGLPCERNRLLYASDCRLDAESACKNFGMDCCGSDGLGVERFDEERRLS